MTDFKRGDRVKVTGTFTVKGADATGVLCEGASSNLYLTRDDFEFERVKPSLPTASGAVVQAEGRNYMRLDDGMWVSSATGRVVSNKFFNNFDWTQVADGYTVDEKWVPATSVTVRSGDKVRVVPSHYSTKWAGFEGRVSHFSQDGATARVTPKTIRPDNGGYKDFYWTLENLEVLR